VLDDGLAQPVDDLAAARLGEAGASHQDRLVSRPTYKRQWA
jgi:hypothetical protein